MRSASRGSGRARSLAALLLAAAIGAAGAAAVSAVPAAFADPDPDALSPAKTLDKKAAAAQDEETPTDPNAVASVAEARRLADAKRFGDAARTLRAVLAANPQNLDARSLLARAGRRLRPGRLCARAGLVRTRERIRGPVPARLALRQPGPRGARRLRARPVLGRGPARRHHGVRAHPDRESQVRRRLAGARHRGPLAGSGDRFRPIRGARRSKRRGHRGRARGARRRAPRHRALHRVGLDHGARAPVRRWRPRFHH